MPVGSTGRNWMLRISIVIALFILMVAVGLSLYLLVNGHTRPPQEEELQTLRHQLDDANRRIAQLEQPVPPPGKAAPDAAFESDLKQHEMLIAELRAERGRAEERIKYASDLLHEVKETEDRTRSAAGLFLGIFGALAAVFLGQSYWVFHGWKEGADKVFQSWQESAGKSLEEIQGVKPDIDLIRATRQTLASKLPEYIADVRHDLVELKLPAGPAVAKMYEIDHLSYLSTEMRFNETRSDEQAKQYLLSLLEAARGRVLQKDYYGAEHRFEEFFEVLEHYPKAVDPADLAKGHSNRAFVYYRLLTEVSSAPSWIRGLRMAEADEMRMEAFAEIRKAKACDKDWWRSYFIEALLCSRQYVPESVTGTARADMFLEGQRKAIGIYSQLIQQGAASRQETGVWQNLACCLKRVADITGTPADYVLFKAELEKFPTDLAVQQGFVQSGRPQTEEVFLWQSMMQDEELFAKVGKINADDYKAFWIDLLNAKVTQREWKVDLAEIKRRAGARMNGWIGLE